MQFPDTPATRLTNQVMIKYRELNPEVPTSEFNAIFTKLWDILTAVPEGGSVSSDDVPRELRDIFIGIVQENYASQMLETIPRKPHARRKIRRVTVGGRQRIVVVPKGPRHTPPKKRRK